MKISRRKALELGGGLGAMMLPSVVWSQPSPDSKTSGDSASDPHYFLFIYLPEGFDVSFMYDARPMALSEAGKIHNYTQEEPRKIVGVNGESTFATNLTKPLDTFKDYFSVINGVHMAGTFQGHGQNLNMMLTGNAFGGKSFLPYLGNHPLDTVRFGKFVDKPVLNNNDRSMILTEQSAYAIYQIAQAKKSKQDHADKFIRSQVSRSGDGKGMFARGVRQYGRAIYDASSLQNYLGEAEVNSPDASLGNRLAIMKSYLTAGVTNTGMLILDEGEFNVDAHDSKAAASYPKLTTAIVAQLVEIFDFLKNEKVPKSSDKTLMDVTTFVFTSEFSRTMRQVGKSMDQTGTDHNPLGNSVLIGGKGIKGGQILGATDLDQVDSNGEFSQVSGVHRALEPQLLSMMGVPFDFERGLAMRQARPDVFKSNDHLSFSSIANTIMTMFGVPQDQHWAFERNGAKAKIIKQLIA